MKGSTNQRFTKTFTIENMTIGESETKLIVTSTSPTTAVNVNVYKYGLSSHQVPKEENIHKVKETLDRVIYLLKSQKSKNKFSYGDCI